MSTAEYHHPSEQELSDLLDERLAPDARQRVRAHLDVCAPCARRSASLAATVALLRRLPELTPPRDFRVGPRAARPRLAARLYPWTRFASAVAAALFVMLFVADLATPAPRDLDGAAPQAAVSAQKAAVPTSSAVTPVADAVAAEAPRPAAAVAARTAASAESGTLGQAADSAAPAATPAHSTLNALNKGTSVPLPTVTSVPPAEPTALPRVSSVGTPVRDTLRPWEALTLSLALLFAAATWVLWRQTRARRAWR